MSIRQLAEDAYFAAAQTCGLHESLGSVSAGPSPWRCAQPCVSWGRWVIRARMDWCQQGGSNFCGFHPFLQPPIFVGPKHHLKDRPKHPIGQDWSMMVHGANQSLCRAKDTTSSWTQGDFEVYPLDQAFRAKVSLDLVGTLKAIPMM